MATLTLDRPRKSERLSKDDYSAFVKWVKSQPTLIDASILVGLSRPTIDRILVTKSAKPQSIEKIRGVINGGREAIVA